MFHSISQFDIISEIDDFIIFHKYIIDINFKRN